VTSSPVRSAVVASSQPTTAGMPSSRATMAAWQVRPPRFVTTAAAVFITVPQSGIVVSATSTSPGRNWPRCDASVTTRALPAAILAPTARPLARSSPLAVNRYSSTRPTGRCEATVSGRAWTM
jgi:hypothetical protein